MKTFVILPARMKSSRLPNKLIKKNGELTLIEHMIVRAKKIIDAVIIVSTDSNIIHDYAIKHCVEAILSKNLDLVNIIISAAIKLIARNISCFPTSVV